MDNLDQVEETLKDVRAFDLGMSPTQYRMLFANIQDIKSNAKTKQGKSKGSIQSES